MMSFLAFVFCSRFKLQPNILTDEWTDNCVQIKLVCRFQDFNALFVIGWTQKFNCSFLNLNILLACIAMRAIISNMFTAYIAKLFATTFANIALGSQLEAQVALRLF